MKIFYKKDFQRVSSELEKKEEKLAYKEKTIVTLHETIDKKDKKIKILEENNEKLSNKEAELEAKLTMVIDDREEVIKKLIKEQNTKGGYVKENNKLKKLVKELTEQVKDLTKQNEDLKSDRYLIKKIPSGKTPTQKINHIPGMSNNVRKFMKDNFDYGGTNEKR